MNRPDISITVCTYNRKEMLGVALDSLLNQRTDGRFSFEIVLIDDGSTDQTQQTVEMISHRAPLPVRYFRENGVGTAEARNRGLKEARGEWIAFFDDDQVAHKNWLRELWDTARRAGADCVGGARLLSMAQEEVSRLHPATRAFLGEILVTEERRKIDREWYPNTGNSLVKRAVIDAVGGFDSSLKYGDEDLDLFRKIRTAGFRVWETPKALVYHVIPPYRLKADYLLWTAFRSGISSARKDALEIGKPKTAFWGCARLGHALFVALPALLWGLLTGDSALVMGKRCQLAKTRGYSRWLLAASGFFRAEKFFSRFEFRKERGSFK